MVFITFFEKTSKTRSKSATTRCYVATRRLRNTAVIDQKCFKFPLLHFPVQRNEDLVGACWVI